MSTVLQRAEAKLSLQQRFRIAKARSTRLLARASLQQHVARAEHKDAHHDWMNECVPEMMDIGKDQDVAVAACLNMWRDAWEQSHPDGAPDPGPPRPDEDDDSGDDEKSLRRGRGFDPNEPRDDHGRWTSGGGGDGDGTAPAANAPSSSPEPPPSSTAPAASSKPKGKGKAKKEDFDKAKIRLSATGGSQGEAKFIEHWNENIGIEPEQFKHDFLGGTDGSMTIKSNERGTRLEIAGDLTNNGGQTIGTYTRNLDLDAGIAKSAYFKLEKSQTKNSIGKKMLAGNVDTYKKLGIDRVEVYANIDVGGYAWAKYGYVPSRSDWNSLRSKLESKLTGYTSGGRISSSSGNTMEADDWSMLSSDTQDNVRDEWMRQTRDEFLSSEVQNWRDSGQALEDAKREVATLYDDRDMPSWFSDALKEVRAEREENGDPPIPYTDRQLFKAIDIAPYESRYNDGRDDPDISFDDNELKEPQGYEPGQLTLPGIEPIDPSSYLSQPMRDQLEKAVTAGFNKEADDRADDVEPPEYLADSVSEYQDEYWSSLSERDKLQRAIDYNMADIEIEPDEDAEPPQQEMELPPPKADEDPVLAALHSPDPKSIWKVADSPRGKQLLLGTNWDGVLNLKDPESMARFNSYVGAA